MSKQVLGTMLLLIVGAACIALYYAREERVPPALPSAQPDRSVEHADMRIAAIETAPSIAKPGRPAAEPVAAPDPAMLATLPALPDDSLPLAQQIDSLVIRAEAGDPVASCRLTLELVRCENFTRGRRFREMMEASVAGRGIDGKDEDAFVDLIAGSEEKSSSDRVHCDGIDPKYTDDPSAYLERAIASMSARQKTMLAMMRPDGRLERLPLDANNLSPAQFDTGYVYPQLLADRGYEFLESGIAARDPLALEGMMIVHTPSWIPGINRAAQPALPNPRLFAYYALVMKGVFGPAAVGQFGEQILQKAIASMPPSERSQLIAEAKRETARWQAIDPAKQAQRKEPTKMCGE